MNRQKQSECEENMEKKMNAVMIGFKLRELRGDRSQVEVAKALGISQSALHMYETGNRIPKDDNKIILARYYHKGIEELFYSFD